MHGGGMNLPAEERHGLQPLAARRLGYPSLVIAGRVIGAGGGRHSPRQSQRNRAEQRLTTKPKPSPAPPLIGLPPRATFNEALARFASVSEQRQITKIGHDRD